MGAGGAAKGDRAGSPCSWRLRADALRGEPARFEEHPLATNRIFIGDLSYRYPFIVDWGTASTFGVLPSFFLQQLDLGLFATAATTGDAW